VVVVLGRDGLQDQIGGHLLLLLCGGDRLRARQDIEAEVAAAFGPLVVLFGQDRTDAAVDAGTVGEDATTSVPAVGLTVEALAGIVGSGLASNLVGEHREGEDVGTGGLECAARAHVGRTEVMAAKPAGGL
jgi:hypothetical protein